MKIRDDILFLRFSSICTILYTIRIYYIVVYIVGCSVGHPYTKIILMWFIADIYIYIDNITHVGKVLESHLLDGLRGLMASLGQSPLVSC